MKGRPVEDLVHEQLFPRPKASDPQNFQAFLQRSLIPEVRQETHAFYGHLETQEAKYPGLDYTHPTHKIRLCRWPCHRRLFRAFDVLRLTKGEICRLTKWEGTKWAKEKFETEQGVAIRDTTADEVSDWAPPPEVELPETSRTTLAGSSQEQIAASTRNLGVLDHEDDANREDESNGEFESVGVHLNERLRDRATRREAGDTSVVLDEEWEQWFKNAIDSGELALLTEQMTEHMMRRAPTTSAIPAALIPTRMLAAARLGQWSEIPEVLHPIVLRTIEAELSSLRAESRRSRASAAETAPRSSLPRASRATIRLPNTQNAF
ncbi:uncharacterized protein MAM_06067 [Metarhizium album ARSEF 1941]|uniref:Uncharacterized protein n=1 Tax=Metarhizium album (strain ARSEF 1941) TaxID=1081103 RepID=A0A0B2WR40_METAS|nr:uncharacterized protein MAM_06067 [Metarhizium album ARSEF 1941]KHN95962.1 hypothetical protein MAM_06067 [Metarhizium album ARSEF 1941]